MSDHRFDHNWHVAINQYNDGRSADGTWCRWMYDGKSAWREAKRLPELFKREREGRLAQTHQQCSHSQPEPVPNNHLTCCLGVKCGDCPQLKAIEASALAPEQQDEAKAWTCIAHVLSSGGDQQNEGFILTVDDRMFWDRVHSNLAAAFEDDGEAA